MWEKRLHLLYPQFAEVTKRLTGILFAGFPLGALFAVYSTLIGKDTKKKTV